MPDDTPPPHDESVDLFERLGLTEYEARTLVALLRLGEATAREVSEVGDVPRTRVYDAVESLHERGLVDVQHSTPQRFTPVSRATALQHFRQEYEQSIEQLSVALDALDTVDRDREQTGVWTVTGSDAVEDRTLEFLDQAESEVVYMAVDHLVTEAVVDRLATLAEEGVEVNVAGSSDTIEDRVRERVPGADVFDSIWQSDDLPAGRLLMVDRRTTLASVLVEQGSEMDETAIWGSGDANSLVVVLRALFTWQLED